MNVAVFCSASDGLSPMFYSEAELIGEALAEAGHGVVYGGCTAGCMGTLARGALSRKGRLIGVVPEMDFMEGIVEPGLTETHKVPNLSARKEAMIRLSDAFLVYPGGLGTLDEALEVLALKSCGNLQKPVIIYNFLGVWTPLLETLELLCEQNLVRQPLSELLHVLDKPALLKEYLGNVLGPAQLSQTQLAQQR